MSYTELHIAKFKVLTHTVEDTLKFIKDNQLEEYFKPKYNSDGTLDYLDVHKEHPKYGVTQNGKFLIEYISYIHPDLEEEGLDEFRKNEDGTYDLMSMFYNGGTCWDEILDEKLSQEFSEDNITEEELDKLVEVLFPPKHDGTKIGLYLEMLSHKMKYMETNNFSSYDEEKKWMVDYLKDHWNKV